MHRVVRVQLLVLAIQPSELGFETHGGLFDADLVFVWVLPVARENEGMVNRVSVDSRESSMDV